MTKQSKRLVPLESPSQPINSRVDIGHVHLKTANIQAVYDFYVGILGFEVVTQLPSALFISAGGYHHHLAFNTWESAGGQPPTAGTTGLYHVAIRYPDRPTLGDALNRLIQANWSVDGASHHGTHEALYLRDPDENGLELYYDLPQSEWPLDDQGHLKFDQPRATFDFEGLLQAGKSLT